MRAGDNLNARALYIYINLAEYSKKVCPFFRMSRKYFNLYLLVACHTTQRQKNELRFTQSFKHIITISRVDRAWALLYRYERVRKLTSD